jgi:hypothetical protein
MQIGHFTTQINPVIMNPVYNEQKWPVPSCSFYPSLTVPEIKVDMLSHFYPEQTNFDVGDGSQLNYLKLKEEICQAREKESTYFCHDHYF